MKEQILEILLDHKCELKSDTEALTELLNLFSVSNNGDKHLEEINDIMWNSLMIKGIDFGRKEGFKIMQVLEEWATPK